MKSLLALVVLLLVGAAGWRIGGQLSADALGMALGVLFGVMASIPTALIVLAARRRADEGPGGRAQHGRRRHSMLPMQNGYPQYQPPVIVVTGNPGGQQQANEYGMGGYDMPRAALPGPMEGQPPYRQFRVVGETDEWVEDW